LNAAGAILGAEIQLDLIPAARERCIFRDFRCQNLEKSSTIIGITSEDIPNDSIAQVRVSKHWGRERPLPFASSIHTAWPAVGEEGGGVGVRAAPAHRGSH